MNGLYSKRHLLERLRSTKCEKCGKPMPSSYPTLIRLERQGVIPRPSKSIEYAGRTDRVYTEKEIEEIVAKVCQYHSKTCSA